MSSKDMVTHSILVLSMIQTKRRFPKSFESMTKSSSVPEDIVD